MAGRLSREPERPMITKEHIIQEIQRVAKKLDGKGLNENQFELYSTIPVETVKYHLGSWEQALKQADLTPVSDEKARGQRQKSNQNQQVKSPTGSKGSGRLPRAGSRRRKERATPKRNRS